MLRLLGEAAGREFASFPVIVDKDSRIHADEK